MPQSEYFPPGGFNFAVEIEGFDPEGFDARFQEVQGLTMELEVENVEETGVNDTKYRIPVRTKYSNLVLKRGLITAGSDLADWCHDTIQDFMVKPIEPKNITVKLLDHQGETLMSWEFDTAIPVKWTISDFNAQQNSIVTETIEFAFNAFRVSS